VNKWLNKYVQDVHKYHKIITTVDQMQTYRKPEVCKLYSSLLNISAKCHQNRSS